jgi:hypothetical protein
MSASKGAGKNRQHYRYQISKKKLDETPPKFSARTFKELVGLCFKGRIISSHDHEIWDILKDGSIK